MTHPYQPALRARVQFLEQKHGVRINWRHGPLAHQSHRPHAPVVDVILPSSWSPDTITVTFDGADYAIRKAYRASPVGDLLETPLEDRVEHLVAVDGRTVYPLVDIEAVVLHPGGVVASRLFDLTFDEAVARAVDYIRSYEWTRERKAFLSWRAESVERRLRTWRGNIRDNDYELGNLTRQIANLVRVNGELRSNIAAVEAHTSVQRQNAAGSDFDTIVGMVPELVESVSLDYGRLRVALAPITIDHEGQSFQMGRYTLTVDGDTVAIEGDQGHDYPHPHVSTDGTPCWGNLAPAIGKLLGEGEYAALVSTVREFLQSFNPRDAYVGIERWGPGLDELDDDVAADF